MSHFNVLVIGENIKEQLQPYHKFECTGENDKYIQEINIYDETFKEYQEHMKRFYKSPEGTLYDPYDDQFYRDPANDEEKSQIGAKIHYIPEGWQEIEKPMMEVKSFAEFAECWHDKEILKKNEMPGDKHKYGWCRVDDDGKVIELIKRTNPNSKWDWWKLGGQWSGYLKLKRDVKINTAKIKTGNKGLMGSCFAEGYDRVDQAPKKYIDFQGMKLEAFEKAKAKYQKVHNLIGESIKEFVSWDEVRNDLFKDDIKKAREFYRDQKAVKALHKDKELIWEDVEDFNCSEEIYCERVKNGVLATFAVVLDGKWYERGSMGWWGIVSDEKDQNEWNKDINELIESLSEDILLSIVDCHI